jgi:hypothetical protein
MARGSTATSSSKESDIDNESARQNDNGSEVVDTSVSRDDKAQEPRLDNDVNDNDVVMVINQQNDYAWEKKLLETLARVSLASVGGGLVGLSLDHARRQQHQQQQQQYTYPPSSSSSSSSPSSRQRPPVAAPMATEASTALKRGASLAKTWSVSCFLFAAIIETTRWISPTTVLYDFMLQKRQQEEEQQQQVENDSGENFQGKAPDNRTTITDTLYSTNFPNQHPTTELQRVALTVTGDYTIGGSLAGFMVASLAHLNLARNTMMISRSKASGMMMPRPAPFGRVAGVGLGTALGLCAGLVQAAIAVGDVYIQQQQQRQPDHSNEPTQ